MNDTQLKAFEKSQRQQLEDERKKEQLEALSPPEAAPAFDSFRMWKKPAPKQAEPTISDAFKEAVSSVSDSAKPGIDAAVRGAAAVADAVEEAAATAAQVISSAVEGVASIFKEKP